MHVSREHIVKQSCVSGFCLECAGLLKDDIQKSGNYHVFIIFTYA